MKICTPRRQLPELQLLNFLAKFLTERKYLMRNFNFYKAETHLGEIIKSIFYI